ILLRSPPLELIDEQFKTTPVNWAIYGSENGWNRKKGDYAGAVAVLLDAGAKPPEKLTGTPPVREELTRRGVPQ
ncbi:MAG: hypothetical protein ABSH22_11735, partial [Tepidisphaeraceae bacterium]